jgi:hypothetical protein
VLIDTTFGIESTMIVRLTLQTAEERALTDDLLVRIGANQHRLRWSERRRHADLAANPATFRIPATHRNARVERAGARARVIYSIIDL